MKPKSGQSTRLGPGNRGVPLGVRYRAACLVFVLTVDVIVTAASLTSFTVDSRIAELWATGAMAFVALCLVWGGRPKLVTGTTAFLVATFAGTALVLHHPLGQSLWWAVAGTGQAALMVVLYRRLRSSTGWAPERAQDLGALLAASTLSNLVLALVGGFPHLAAGQFSVLMLWWVVRATVASFVCAVILLTLFYWDRPDVLEQTSVVNVLALLCAAGVGVYGTYADPSQSQSWLMLVPFVWAGLTLTPCGTAGLSLGVVLGAAVITLVPRAHFGYVGLLPAATMVDLLVISGISVAMLLALMRDQRDRLIVELDRRSQDSEAQRRMLEIAFDGITDGVIITDARSVMRCNPAAEQLLGRAISGEAPADWAAALRLRDDTGRPLTNDDFQDQLVVSAGERKEMELTVGDAAEERRLEVTTLALPWDQRAATLVLIRDVTAARQRVRALREFAGLVAHDLRGPLTGLEGWLEVISDARSVGDDSALDEGVTRAQHATGRMRQVVEDWLAYTVAHDGDLRPEPVDLDTMVREVAQPHGGEHSGNAARFELDLSHSVCADPVLLRQLFDNLFGNAVKYTEPGRLPLITVRSAYGEEGRVQVEVVDDGIGIPEGQEEAIFREFHRGGAEGRSAGTGLGLALSRRIVLRHGGRISAHRNAGGGSTFTFTLPPA